MSFLFLSSVVVDSTIRLFSKIAVELRDIGVRVSDSGEPPVYEARLLQAFDNVWAPSHQAPQ